MKSPAQRAGVRDLESFSRRFLPTLALPALAALFSPLGSLVLLLVVLRLPHLALWFMAKERRRRVCRELPLFVSSLKWLLRVYPVQEALCFLDVGEVSRAFQPFCRGYAAGEPFEEALMSCAVFPELGELAKRLMVVYRTGSGAELLDLYADRVSAGNLAGTRRSAARMQLFAVAYTSVVAVLPAMHSGLSLYSGGGSVLPLSLAAGALLVVLWKLLD